MLKKYDNKFANILIILILLALFAYLFYYGIRPYVMESRNKNICDNISEEGNGYLEDYTDIDGKFGIITTVCCESFSSDECSILSTEKRYIFKIYAINRMLYTSENMHKVFFIISIVLTWIFGIIFVYKNKKFAYAKIAIIICLIAFIAFALRLDNTNTDFSRLVTNLIEIFGYLFNYFAVCSIPIFLAYKVGKGKILAAKNKPILVDENKNINKKEESN